MPIARKLAPTDLSGGAVDIRPLLALTCVAPAAAGCAPPPPAPVAIQPLPVTETTSAHPRTAPSAKRHTYPPLPTAMPGQIAYTTYVRGTDAQEVMLADARADRTYVLEAFCRPLEDGAEPVAYEVRTEADEFLSGGAFTCDGTRQRQTVLVGTSGSVVVTLTGALDDVGAVFAAIVPRSGR